MLPSQKIIAFDLDGTLAESKRAITSAMADILKKLIKQKIVVIISGGSFKQFQTQFLPPFSADDFLSTYGSRLIILPTSGSQHYGYDSLEKQWQLIDKEPLAKDIREKAKELFEEVIASGSYDIPPHPYGPRVEDRETQVTFSGLGQEAPIEEKMLWDLDKKKRQKIKDYLEPRLHDATILINATSSIDILPKGFNKAVGLSRLLVERGLEKKDMVFVGDGLFPNGNDYAVHEANIQTISVSGPEETAHIIQEWIG
jgi:phosphomannomutase